MTFRVPFRATQYRNWPNNVLGSRPIFMDSTKWLDPEDHAFLEQIRITGKVGCGAYSDFFRDHDFLHDRYSLRTLERRSREADRERSQHFNPTALELLEQQWAERDHAEAERALRRAVQRSRTTERRRQAEEAMSAEWLRQAAEQAQRDAWREQSDQEWDEADPVRRAAWQLKRERNAKRAADAAAKQAAIVKARIAKQGPPKMGRRQYDRFYRANFELPAEQRRRLIERWEAHSHHRRIWHVVLRSVKQRRAAAAAIARAVAETEARRQAEALMTARERQQLAEQRKATERAERAAEIERHRLRAEERARQDEADRVMRERSHREAWLRMQQETFRGQEFASQHDAMVRHQQWQIAQARLQAHELECKRVREHIVRELDQAACTGYFRARPLAEVLEELGCSDDVLRQVLRELADEGRVSF